MSNKTGFCFVDDCENEAVKYASVADDTGLCATHEREAYQRERMDKIAREDGKPALEALCKLTGWHGDGEAVFADQFFRQHRTHQQSIMRLFVRLIIEMEARAAKNGMPTWTDLRNEEAFKLAQALAPTVRRFPLPYL